MLLRAIFKHPYYNNFTFDNYERVTPWFNTSYTALLPLVEKLNSDDFHIYSYYIESRNVEEHANGC